MIHKKTLLASNQELEGGLRSLNPGISFEGVDVTVVLLVLDGHSFHPFPKYSRPILPPPDRRKDL